MASWGRYTDQYHSLPEFLPQRLELYIGLGRAGTFDEADRLFSQSLSQHLGFAPVFFEHADALLNQGRFGSLDEYLTKSSPWFDPGSDQSQLLILMKHLAKIYVSGALLPALRAARQIKESIPLQTQWEQCSAYQLHSIELYIRIIKYAFVHSNWVDEEDQQLPGTHISEASALSHPWAASALWLDQLIQRRLWLPAKIFTKIAASVVPQDIVMTMYRRLRDSLPDLTNCHQSILFAHIATHTAFSQYLSWKKVYNEATNAAQTAEKLLLLAASQAGDSECFPRERIECEFAKGSLEQDPHLDKIQHLRRAATIANEHDDLASESRALSAMLDIPSTMSNRPSAEKIFARLDHVEGYLQPDLPLVLYEKQRLLGLTGHDDLGKLAEWFSHFEKGHPTSSIIHETELPERLPSSDTFDNPQALYYKASALSRIYMVLGNKPREDKARDEMDSLEAHMPHAARALFASDTFASEWFGKTARVFNPETGMRVLMRRIASAWERGTFSPDELKEVVPNAVVSNENPKVNPFNQFNTESLRKVLFGPPLRQDVWQQKLLVIKGWLSRDTFWKPASSDLLIATLLYYRQLHHIDSEENSQPYCCEQ